MSETIEATPDILAKADEFVLNRAAQKGPERGGHARRRARKKFSPHLAWGREKSERRHA